MDFFPHPPFSAIRKDKVQPQEQNHPSDHSTDRTDNDCVGAGLDGLEIIQKVSIPVSILAGAHNAGADEREG
eukprot:scaffold73_cov337-Pavlova_lutheri.AAC.2